VSRLSHAFGLTSRGARDLPSMLAGASSPAISARVGYISISSTRAEERWS